MCPVHGTLNVHREGALNCLDASGPPLTRHEPKKPPPPSPILAELLVIEAISAARRH
jgi:hypothetical protein